MAASFCYQRNKAHLFFRLTKFDVVNSSFQLWAWAATFVGPRRALSIAERFPTGNRAVNRLSVISRPTLIRLNWKNCCSTVGNLSADHCWPFSADCLLTVGRQCTVRRPTNLWGAGMSFNFTHVLNHVSMAAVNDDMLSRGIFKRRQQ